MSLKQTQLQQDQLRHKPPIEREEITTRQTQVATVSEQAIAIHQEMEKLREKRELDREALLEKETKKQFILDVALEAPTQSLVYSDRLRVAAGALEAGVGLPDVLRTAFATAPFRERRLWQSIALRVEGGEQLSVAMKANVGHIPSIMIPLVEHHERYGTISQALRQLSDAFSKRQELERVYEYNPMLTSAIGSAQIKGALTVPKRGGTRLNRAGIIGNLQLSTSWQMTFATLWECGVAPAIALEASALTLSHRVMQKQLLEAADKIRMGSTLSAALEQNQLVSTITIETLRTAEISGDFGPLLEGLSKRMTDDANALGWQLLVWICIMLALIVGAIEVAALGALLGGTLTMLLWGTVFVLGMGYCFFKLFYLLTANDIINHNKQWKRWGKRSIGTTEDSPNRRAISTIKSQRKRD